MNKRVMLVLVCLLGVMGSAMAKSYVFFLHNAFLESNGLNDKHPEYGRVEYKEILDAFSNNGYTVIADIRSNNTNVQQYARKVAMQIDTLIARGAKPENILVVGTSKGGYIAQYVSMYVANPGVSYVFIGACSAGNMSDDVNYCGNILSIHEKSDKGMGSCEALSKKSSLKVVRFKDIELHTGLKHGFLFRAMPEWLEPCIHWGKHEYDKM